MSLARVGEDEESARIARPAPWVSRKVLPTSARSALTASASIVFPSWRWAVARSGS